MSYAGPEIKVTTEYRSYDGQGCHCLVIAIPIRQGKPPSPDQSVPVVDGRAEQIEALCWAFPQNVQREIWKAYQGLVSR